MSSIVHIQAFSPAEVAQGRMKYALYCLECGSGERSHTPPIQDRTSRSVQSRRPFHRQPSAGGPGGPDRDRQRQPPPYLRRDCRAGNRVGHGLRKLGLQEEQRVLLVLPDIPEFAAAYFGTMKIGAVAVPTSTALRASDCAYFLEESRARVAIVHSTLLAEFEPALAGQRDCSNVIVCGE